MIRIRDFNAFQLPQQSFGGVPPNDNRVILGVAISDAGKTGGQPRRIIQTARALSDPQRAPDADALWDALADGGCWVDDPPAPTPPDAISLLGDEPATADRLAAAADGRRPPRWRSTHSGEMKTDRTPATTKPSRREGAKIGRASRRERG